MRRVLCVQLLTVGLAGLLTGCSGSSDKWVQGREPVHPISGRVTLKGEPVEGAILIFHSTAKELSAQGRTDADGNYSVTTYEDGDGAVLGEHIVTVRKTKEVKKPTKYHTEDEPSYATFTEELLPKESSSKQTSKLRVTVAEGGSADVNFEF
ncbi:MAG: carboxypeptidase-like regulatory domain-containing protein [Planctomycetaceae bacterium]